MASRVVVHCHPKSLPHSRDITCGMGNSVQDAGEKSCTCEVHGGADRSSRRDLPRKCSDMHAWSCSRTVRARADAPASMCRPRTPRTRTPIAQDGRQVAHVHICRAEKALDGLLAPIMQSSCLFRRNPADNAACTTPTDCAMQSGLFASCRCFFEVSTQVPGRSKSVKQRGTSQISGREPSRPEEDGFQRRDPWAAMEWCVCVRAPLQRTMSRLHCRTQSQRIAVLRRAHVIVRAPSRGNAAAGGAAAGWVSAELILLCMSRVLSVGSPPRYEAAPELFDLQGDSDILQGCMPDRPVRAPCMCSCASHTAHSVLPGVGVRVRAHT